MKSKVVTGFIFIVCAIPGVFTFLTSSLLIAMRMLDARIKSPQWRYLVTGSLLGGLLILVGIGKLSRPAYLFVFASIPISGWFFAQLDRHAVTGIIGFVAWMGLACYLTLYGVKKYYSWRRPEKIIIGN